MCTCQPEGRETRVQAHLGQWGSQLATSVLIKPRFIKNQKGLMPESAFTEQ